MKYIMTVLLFLSGAYVQAAAYYVSPSGSDAYDGLAPTFVSGTHGPWQHICWAFGGGGTIWATINNGGAASCSASNPNKLQAGDTLYLRAGTYQENNITLANSGTSGNNITIGGYPRDALPVLDGGQVNASGNNLTGICFPIINDDQSYVQYQNFRITRGYQWLIGINRNVSGSSHTINGMILDNLIVYDNSSMVQVGGNGGITNYLTLANNNINTLSSPNPGGSGCGSVIEVGAGNVTNFNISNNVFNNLACAVQLKHGGGLTAGVSQVFSNNIVTNSNGGSGGGLIWNGSYGTISNNLITGGKGAGILLFQDEGSCSDEIVEFNQVYHNTIVGNGPAGIYETVETGCTPASNNTLRDNVIQNNFGSGFQSLSILVYNSSDASATRVGYNLIYDSNTGSPINDAGGFYTVANEPPTFLGYGSAKAPAFGSISQQAIFVNPTANNYQLCVTGQNGCSQTSPGHNAASDGTDMGVQFCAVGINASCSGGGVASAPPAAPRGFTLR